MVVRVLVCFLLLARQPVCSAKRPSRPSLLQASRLVVEFSKVEGCDEPGNAIRYYNVATRMVSKTDFSLSGNFNVTRSVPSIDSIQIQITKCRETVSSNSCERFQTWRFEKNPCKGFDSPSAVWGSARDRTKPRLSCPFKEGTYSLQNITISTSLLESVPLPWEGNVWLVRFGMLDTKTRFHICTDSEMHVHRVRDN